MVGHNSSCCLIFSISDVLVKNRQLLAVEDGTSEGLSTEDPTASSNEATETETETETEPEGSASCNSEFDGTIGVFLFLAGVLYCFVGLAIICEGEFKDSVVEIARFLNLPPDVAGKQLVKTASEQAI